MQKIIQKIHAFKANCGLKSIPPMKGKVHIYFLLNFQKNMFFQNAEQPNLLPPSNPESRDRANQLPTNQAQQESQE